VGIYWLKETGPPRMIKDVIMCEMGATRRARALGLAVAANTIGSGMEARRVRTALRVGSNEFVS
jgi:hypothetical protein